MAAVHARRSGVRGGQTPRAGDDPRIASSDRGTARCDQRSGGAVGRCFLTFDGLRGPTGVHAATSPLVPAPLIDFFS